MPGWIFSEDSWTSARNWTKRTLLLAAFAAECRRRVRIAWPPRLRVVLEAPAEGVFQVIFLGGVSHISCRPFRLQIARSSGSRRELPYLNILPPTPM